ncbi:amidase [Rhodovibrionaceae bacterium A322]
MSDLDLCYLPATQALKRFKDRSLSPVELLDALIARAEETKDTVNAFTYTHFDEARDKAKKAEAKYMKTDGRLRALEGLPVGIKDESDIKGKPTSVGSLILKDYVAERTSVGNERIQRAGGIIHARTATPEFCCAGYTHTRLWGVTRNPWNLDYTPGGSSGGSSASLAAGTSPIATGSDIGGSIRIPASTCGLVGYKPPYGRNPDDPPFNLDFYCHTGPMARTVDDAILLQNIMCGPHPTDIASLRPKLRLPKDYKPIKGWKIAFSMDLGFFEIDPEVKKNTLEALEVFKSLGATVEEVDLGWTHEVLDAAIDYLTHLFGASMAPMLEEHADKMTNYARTFAENGAKSSSGTFYNSLEVAGQMYQTLGPLLEKYNLLVCPTSAIPAVPADFDQINDKVEINGKEVNAMLGWVLTTPFNTMSRCPVISMPSGRASNGVPTGIQLVGRTYSDATVFQAAKAYESAAPGWFDSAATRPSL